MDHDDKKKQNTESTTIGHTCNYNESICPIDTCCSDLICKNQQTDYKCCEMPKAYNRNNFSEYVVTEEGWGCSNCPKCDNGCPSEILVHYPIPVSRLKDIFG